MQRTLYLISLVLISFFGFSQKITITDFSPQQWTSVYEDENMQFFYKYEDNSSVKENGRKFILFKIKNKTNSVLNLNVNVISEFNNVDQSFSHDRHIKIEPNEVLEGKSTGDGNIRLPYEKFKEIDKNLKNVKIDF